MPTAQDQSAWWHLRRVREPLLLWLVLAVGLPNNLYAQIAYGVASWYSTEACKYNPDPKCPMANGESLYEAEAKGEKFAAMWDVPFGTRIRVSNLRNARSTIVTIKDRGPAKRLHRQIDLSKRAFTKIASRKEGIIQVKIEEIT